tara:strand:- start:609 stop:803 length:195 start_codon:yes stop_codon:yes gene_type:complete
MTNTNNLKDMSPEQVKRYIRSLEVHNNQIRKTTVELEAMDYFQIEDYVAELEKERGFQDMAKDS